MHLDYKVQKSDIPDIDVRTRVHTIKVESKRQADRPADPTLPDCLG